MHKTDLCGAWSLTDSDKVPNITATVPGCNFLDLVKAEIIPDPFIGCNEKTVQWVGQHDWTYSRSFEMSEDDLEKQHVELVFEMLDTLAEITVNDVPVASVQNAYRKYVFDVKKILRVGENSIVVKFRNCLDYIAQWQKAMPMINTTEGEAGSCHIRKPAYHFGWDWAPHLLQCGMIKPVYIIAYDGAKLDGVRIRQKHGDGKVALDISPEFAGEQRAEVHYSLKDPDGSTIADFDKDGDASVEIASPKLWQCNGCGEQPLYTLTAVCADNKDDVREYKIGLRTIELDLSSDEWGTNFRFIVNGKPVFARGSNWVPTDSFISRTTYDDLKFLISTAAHANMNMLRVWGGAYYESDDFYDLCDRYGILVWQDCMFACSPFPYGREDFVAEVDKEIEDNVRRIRHHASLALWNGNNEVEQMSLGWRIMVENIKQTGPFYYQHLPEKIKEFDDVTPYWPGSPTGGEFLKDIYSTRHGDTHLWKAWHGLRPISYFLGNYTRFCSEFGFQAFAHENTLRTFGEGKLPDSLDGPLMKLHQKAMAGNSRTQYYIIERYWSPARLWDLVYLTQLNQADCAELSTEHWRRNKGRCNGALYWQYNDCWGVTSWSGIDWYRNLKAVTYRARHFNAPVTATISLTKKTARFHLINDSTDSKQFTAKCAIVAYDGGEVVAKERIVDAAADSVTLLQEFDLPISPKRRNCYAVVRVYDGETLVSERIRTLSAEKYAALPKDPVSFETAYDGSTYSVTVAASAFARGVELSLKDINVQWSDNFFDMTAGETVTVTTAVAGRNKEELDAALSVRSLVDIPRKRSLFADKIYRRKLFFEPLNFANWIARSIEE